MPFLSFEYYGRVEENRAEAKPKIKENKKYTKYKKELMADSIKEMYENNDEDNINKYINSSINKLIKEYPDRIDNGEITRYRKDFMKKYFRNNFEELNILLSDSTIDNQIVAIKNLKKRVSEEDYFEYKSKILSTRLISAETWMRAELESQE